MKKVNLSIYSLIIIFILSGCSVKYETNSGDKGSSTSTVTQNAKSNSDKPANTSSTTTSVQQGKTLPKNVSNSQGEVQLTNEVKVVQEKASNSEVTINYTVSDYNGFYSAVYDTLKNFKSSVNVKISNYNADKYRLDVIYSVLKDHSDIDYGINSGSASLYLTAAGEKIMHIEFNYKFSKDKMLNMKNESKAKASQIVKSVVKPGMTDKEKELALHDYLVNHTKYDFENYVKGTVPGESYTDYGALVLGTAVCSGYAKAMYSMLNLAGIKSIIVQGYGDEVLHTWNLVYINGKYRHVDATWDDPISEGNILTHDYFNVTDSQLAKDHSWNRADYPVSN